MQQLCALSEVTCRVGYLRNAAHADFIIAEVAHEHRVADGANVAALRGTEKTVAARRDRRRDVGVT